MDGHVPIASVAEADEAGTITAMERAALDPWGRGDPFGFLLGVGQVEGQVPPGTERDPTAAARR